MMWQVDRPIVVGWYVVMIVCAFVLYLYAVTKKIHTIPLLLSTCCLLLIVSNNALSHDIYNYMFNAKAIAMYHQDPHVLSALEIAPNDEWVRFMHNVQTTAPYGHVWTSMTLVPYYLGLGKFLTTYLSFKLFMAVGLALLTWIQWRMLTDKTKIWLFVLNPLVLIETLSSGHNDVWMMALALGSFALLFKAKKTFSIVTLLSLGLLVLSTQIKEATIVLVPLWAVMALKENHTSTRWITLVLRMMHAYWAEIAVLLLFIPLVTSRSQQFNPWYLIWPLTFLPFVKTRLIRVGLIVFSLSSLLRYVPFLFVAGYSDALQLQMRLITWSAIPLTVLVDILLSSRLFKRR